MLTLLNDTLTVLNYETLGINIPFEFHIHSPIEEHSLDPIKRASPVKLIKSAEHMVL